MYWEATTVYDNIVLGVLFFFLIVQIYYYLGYFTKVSYYKNKESKNTHELPVSVIIAARNESENLQAFLDSILTQDYPTYEVVVINDCSYDNSTDVLKGYLARYSNLKVVELEEDDKYKHGKKFALTLGIKAAKHEHLLLTDADCKTVSKDWIRLMQQGFTDKKEIVIGHSPYIKTAGFLNAFSRYETFFTAIQYFSFALRKQTYMGVGRNLAYTKSIFFKNKGFASHMHLLSGDDDLFVNQNASKENVSICLEPDSFIYTPAKTNWVDYFKQKARHFSVSKEYKFTHKFNLSLIAISHTFFYLVLMLGFATKVPVYLVGGILLIKLIITSIIYYPAMKRLGVKDIFPIYIILDLLYFIIIPFWALISMFFKPKKWK